MVGPINLIPTESTMDPFSEYEWLQTSILVYHSFYVMLIANSCTLIDESWFPRQPLSEQTYMYSFNAPVKNMLFW